MGNNYRIRYYGSFALLAPDGHDITPRGSKARGLLAILAEGNGMRRGRRWLESKLWSDRSPFQASASLRQTLTELRHCFAPDETAFQADRLDVWLDAERFETDLSADCPWRDFDRELLEGLDVRDAEFDAWKRALALRDATPDSPQTHVITKRATQALTIRAEKSDAGTGAERVAGQIIADQVAKALEERLSALRFEMPDRKKPQRKADIEIRCDVSDDGTHGLVFLRVEDGQDGHILFSGHRKVPGTTSDVIDADAIAGLVHSAASKIVHRVPALVDLTRPEAAALGFSSLGVRNLAKFDPHGFENAQDYFDRAYRADGNGVYLAWRAFVRMAQLLERAPGDPQARMEEVDELTTAALQQTHGNGLAVALVALTRIMLEDDLEPPADLARQAMLWNDHNLFAKQTLAVAHSAVGDTEKAYELSLACQRMQPEDDLGHLWDLYHSLVCISAGRFQEARVAAARASAAAPSFVAPRRQLVALCAHAGDLEAARTYLKELRKLEPGFSLGRYLNDPDYPVLTLRNAGLIESLQKSRLIG